MQAKIEITLKSGHSFIVPKQAEASQRRMNGHNIDFIRPVGEGSKVEQDREDAIQAMIDKKEKEIQARLAIERPEETASTGNLTMSATKAQIMTALETAGIKFNPNHRKQDLFNIYVSSRTN